MICQAILLPILGMASLFSVALAQASQRSSLDTTRDPLNWCGQDEKVHALGREDGLAALEALSKRSFDTEQASIHIPVNVFLVGTEEQRNSVKYKTEIRYIGTTLNEGYAKHGITFGPIETYEVANDTYANMNYMEHRHGKTREMQRALRIGGPETLNLYIVPKLDTGLLGYAAFPDLLTNPFSIVGATGTWFDGDAVVIGHSALDGTLFAKAVIHETGHWLGLYHPFQGSCKVPNGDYIPDTPQSRHENYACKAKDTCPDFPGEDLVWNYMAYSACDKNLSFTPGQALFMRQSWYSFRDPKTRDLPAESQVPYRTTPNKDMIVHSRFGNA
ncbi:hypothetical protein COL516b_007832 [Colletotrichum fioriniae]|nr:uncharacterized protein COL516b_007832 [Colletotrichum fioriniae]KAJ0301429.1 hypothetical protein COL516b_007832 [Colletotrichum fioriniae]